MKNLLINLLAATVILGAVHTANADSQYSTANYQKNLTGSLNGDDFTKFDEVKYPKANIESNDVAIMMQADIALAQGAYAYAAEPYYSLAMKYKDPRIIYSALACYQHVPYNAETSKKTVALVQELLSVAPDSNVSKLYGIGLNLEQDNFAIAKDNLDYLISKNKDKTSNILLFVATLLSDSNYKLENPSITKFGDYVQDKYGKYPEGLLVSSIAYSNMGDKDKLSTVMKQMYKQNPDWELPVFWNAGILVNENKLGMLESFINDEIILRKKPSANMQNLFVAVYLRLNQIDKANQYVIASKEYEHKDANMMVNKAIIDYQLNDVASSLKLLHDVESNDYELNGAIDFAIGSLEGLNSNRATAIHHFKEAASGNPILTASSGIGIIHSYLVESNFAEADKYIDSMPQTADKANAKSVLMAKLAIYTQLQRYQYAYKLAKQNLKQYQKDKDFYYMYVSLSGLADDTNNAIKLYKKFIKDNPKITAGYNDLAYILAEQTNNYAESLKYAKIAYKMTPNDPAVLDTIGWAEYKNKNYSAAEKYLEQSYALSPTNDTAKHLKAIYLANNKPEKASRVIISDLNIDKQIDKQLADQSMMLLMYYQFGADLAKTN
ncbi:MAG: hypothetical protein PHC75_04545 [Burkholderiales bacterium]|nr:hypothetical protein [Burkholderiales bacterium]